MKCAVIGGSNLPKDMTAEQQDELRGFGAWLADEHIELLTGACWGFPHLVSEGCMARGGTSIGYSPATNREEDVTVYGHPQRSCTSYRFLDAAHQGVYARLLMRSVPLVDDADVAVSIEGNWGTMMEMVSALVCGKPLVVWESSGGASGAFREAFNELSAHNLNHYSNDAVFVQSLEEVERALLKLRSRNLVHA
ncbi:MAG: hypothetical protein ACOX1O_06730 [Eggerthellaceae bacterium]|jgi:predicted Rossmann-fold nucleotide-binding protein